MVLHAGKKLSNLFYLPLFIFLISQFLQETRCSAHVSRCSKTVRYIGRGSDKMGRYESIHYSFFCLQFTNLYVKIFGLPGTGPVRIYCARRFDSSFYEWATERTFITSSRNRQALSMDPFFERSRRHALRIIVSCYRQFTPVYSCT